MSRKRGLEVSEVEQQSDNSGAEKLNNFVFKNPDFKHANIVGGKKKPWKTLKQILTAEQSLSWPEEAVTYSSLEAPPSFTPAKKYSDLSGLEAAYTDPQTKLHYACS